MYMSYIHYPPLVNGAVALLIIVWGSPEDVSGSLLGIFMVNMALYLFYYIGMKIYYSAGTYIRKLKGHTWIIKSGLI